MVQPKNRRLATEAYADLPGAVSGTALTTEDLNAIRTPGNYFQVNNSNATLARNYPVNGMGGSLVVLPIIPSIQRPTQLFVLNHWVGSAMYVRSFNGTEWSGWQTYMTQASADNRYYQKSVLDAGYELTTENISGVLQPGNHYQANNANATAERGYPVPGMGGTLINLQLIPSIQRMTQLFILNHGVGSAMYVRSLTGSGWTDWSTYMTQSSSDNRYYQKTVLDPILADITASGAPADAAEHDYRLSDLRARRGPVKVATPGAVVLAFDHGLTKFKSIVMPMLAARGLPVTLAVNSQLLTDPTNSGATTADLSTWAAGPLVEIANHGRTHTYPSNVEFEIRGGREELEAIIAQEVDTYVQAGITGDTWGGNYEDVAGSPRGRIAYSAHAILAGVMPTSNNLYPIDGNPNPGAKGSWIDNGGAQITAARARVEAAVAAEAFTIIRLHPEHVDGASRITSSDLAEFLDWIVDERDAGRITVLQLRDASIATHA